MYIVAQQAAAPAQSVRELSQSTAHHAMASGAPGAFDMALVALGAIVVTATTIYSVLYLIRPGETGEDHIKRRILEDGTRESR